MSYAHPWTAFAERHAWQIFLALGVVFIYFGASDLNGAVTYGVKETALSGLIFGLLGTAISVTALRDGARWAWLAMFVWPFFGLFDTFFLLTEPGASFDVGTIAEIALLVVVPLLALVLSGPRYLRSVP